MLNGILDRLLKLNIRYSYGDGYSCWNVIYNRLLKLNIQSLCRLLDVKWNL